MKSKTLAVAVVRLQVPELHAGHRYLLNSMSALHSNILVVIGTTEARLTPDDPLTPEMREAMLKANYPQVQVAFLPDHPSDYAWSTALDNLIQEHLTPDTSPPVLYGGRDSFLAHYHGTFRTFELPPADNVSGTEVREAVEPKMTADFRAGMIYAARLKYPTSYQCVDVIVVNQRDEVLVGQKDRDGGKWRFPGGFVSPKDASLEAAAARELREETGVEPGDMVYIGSLRVDDYRYPASGSDQLMTAVFASPHIFGPGEAGDDLDRCTWLPSEGLREQLVPEHQPIYDLVQKWSGNE